MSGMLVDPRTLVRVRAAGPMPVVADLDAIRATIVRLGVLARDGHGQIGYDGKTYYSARVMEVSCTEDELSARKTGAILRGFGLDVRRRNFGMLVLWNDEQLEILREYFG